MGECLKQLQGQATMAGKNERPGNAVRGKFRCWCCGEEGHMLMQCPTSKGIEQLRMRLLDPRGRKTNKGPDQDVRGPCV